MPNKPLYHPNERVDLEDFTQSSRGYTDSKTSFDAIKQFLGKRARLLEGFRVEVPLQTPATAGEFVVHNGVALDKLGRPLSIEASVGASKARKLVGFNTFFIEIGFIEAPSETDARAFWDPTFPNTSPDVDGKEFNLDDKATRLTPLWEVVINTTGFKADRTSPAFDPTSSLIPLAILETDGSNEIVIQGSIVLVVVSGVLEEDVAATDTELRLLNSRIFPVTATDIIIGDGGPNPETLPIIGNDRDSGVITVAGVAFAHKAGEVIRVSGGDETFIPQRTGPVPNLDGPSTDHPDTARRQFQGDEKRGKALTTSKDAATSAWPSRDDLNIETLKDEVDALSALIHEMKFGSRRPDELGTLADDHFDRLPPHVVTTPRYWDMAGSLMGVRTATLTIGDGSTTFGDFNGADHKPFQDAVDNLPSSGGTIFIKGGTYTFTTEVVYTTKSVIWVGESKDLVSISFDSGGQSMFQTTTASSAAFRNLTLTKSGGNQRAIRLEDVVDCRIENCVIDGEVFVLAPVSSGAVQVVVADSIVRAIAADRRALRIEDTSTLRVENSLIVGEVHFLDPTTLGGTPAFRALNSFFTAAAVADTSAFRGAGAAFSFSATNCSFFADDTVIDQRVIRFESEITSGLVEGCDFTVRDGAIFAIEDDITSFSLNNAKMTTTTGGALVDAADASVWSSVHFNGIEVLNPSAATLDASKTDYIQLGILQNCSFKNIRTANPLFANDLSNSFIRWGATDHFGIFFNQVVFENITINFSDTAGGRGIAAPGADGHTGPYDVTVRRCEFIGCSIGVVCRKPGTLSVDDCRILGGLTGTHQGNRGVTCGPRSASTVQDITIEDSTFKLIQGTPEINAFGVQVLGPTAPPPGSQPPDNMFASLTVKNNIFTEIGNPTLQVGGIVAAISTELNTRMSHIVITGNEFDRMNAGGTSILRSIFLRGDDMGASDGSITPHAIEGTFIHDNSFHDQGNLSVTLDNGFIEVDRTLGDSGLDSCKIHDNIFTNLFGGAIGMFAIRLDSEVVSRSSVCRNAFVGIGQNTTDLSVAGGVIHVVGDILLDVQISENTINQQNVLGTPSLSGIRLFASTKAINLSINNNTVLCGTRTYRAMNITGVEGENVTVMGNAVDDLAQTFTTAEDAGIYVSFVVITNIVVTNNSVRELLFKAERAGIWVEVAGDGLICSNNMIRMPDPGGGNTRIRALEIGGSVEGFVIANNVLFIADATPTGTNTAGIRVNINTNRGLIVGNYVTPSVGGAGIDFGDAGDDVLALANLVGSTAVTGAFASPTAGHAKQAATLTLLARTNVVNMTP